MKKRRKKKYQPRQIAGLTWTQKLAIESVLDSAIDFFIRFVQCDEDDLGDIKTRRAMAKTLAMFRKKTKHMHKPRRRRKKRGAK